ncbi:MULTISPECIES: hypothetical protein [unclassified Spirosoma]|uniref:hypothetical protein n=1 Tax=unclassified Spirosoma TaxID=2621999 RepID=UPI00095EEE78|nr:MULTISPECIES: hypothetical protein [unclassified Spirosoma]MBN8820782.1 hypothetical protein [Spirosoma sp.]OJW76375.1 MAG: hypothetical protein BGO59_22915 [Spirosoma sp. 48-14]
MSSLAILKITIESQIRHLLNTKISIEAKKKAADSEFSAGYWAAALHGVDDERKTLEKLLKDVDELIQIAQSQPPDAEKTD